MCSKNEMRREDSDMPVKPSTIESSHESFGPSTGEKIEVERGRFASLKLYEVAEHELILIEKGSDASLWLNFAIASASIFFSILAALLSLDHEGHQVVFIVFVVICAVTAFSTLLCGSFWYKSKNTQKEIFKTIRKRIKTEG